MKTIDKYLNESPDDRNPKYLFSGVDTILVLAFANGKLDAKEYAKFELQNRGFGKKGEWVGFPESEKIWKSKIKG